MTVPITLEACSFPIRHRIPWLVLVPMLVALGGCATLAPDGGVGTVQMLVQERIGKYATLPKGDPDAVATAASTRARLAMPLTAEAAVQVALLNNPGLKADLAELGISDADLVQAGRIPNPVFRSATSATATPRPSNAR